MGNGNDDLGTCKLWITSCIGAFSVIMIAGMGIQYINADKLYDRMSENEKNIEQRIQYELGRVKTPLLTVYNSEDGNDPLDGGSTSIEYSKENKEIYFNCILKNSGTGNSGPIYLKIYTDDIKFTNHMSKSTDESKYKYEAYNDASTQDMPGGGYTGNFYYKFYPDDTFTPPTGEHNFMVKIYYGQNKVTTARFRASITNI